MKKIKILPNADTIIKLAAGVEQEAFVNEDGVMYFPAYTSTAFVGSKEEKPAAKKEEKTIGDFPSKKEKAAAKKSKVKKEKPAPEPEVEDEEEAGEDEPYTLKELKGMDAKTLKKIITEDFETDLAELAKERNVKRWSVASLSEAIMDLQEQPEDDAPEEEVEDEEEETLEETIETLLRNYNEGDEDDDYTYEKMEADLLDLIDESKHEEAKKFLDKWFDNDDAEYEDAVEGLVKIINAPAKKKAKKSTKKSRTRSKKGSEKVLVKDWSDLEIGDKVEVELKDSGELHKGEVIGEKHEKYSTIEAEEDDIVVLFDDGEADWLDEVEHSKVYKLG